MMSKINTNQTTDFEPVNAARKSDVKQTGSEKIRSVEQRNNVGEDKVQFSGRATEAKNLVDRLKELPDVRQEKVNAIREQILSGEYKPSSGDIADAILKDES